MTSEVEVIYGRRAYAEAVESLVPDVQLRISLYSHSLDPKLYATGDTMTALRNWLTSNRRAELRILVENPRAVVARPNRLLHLGLQLSSHVSFRETPPNQGAMPDRLIIDERHLLQQSHVDSQESSLWRDGPARARDALREFNVLWEESLISQELRRQSL